MRHFLALAVAACLASAGTTASASPPPHAGGAGGKGGPPAHAGGPGKGGSPGAAHGRPARGNQTAVRFQDRDRVVIRDYYADLRHCPPGLAKKRNGCMPPGQAKKAWRVGRVLPPDIVYYDLPPELTIRLSPLSPGHRYVRVGADILKLAVGTGLIVDAIESLGRM
ncbi:MAG: hypothetical protein ACK4QW_12460 [Alphaproteobacteria bacterium]